MADDKDFWHTTDPNDLWLFDKLILAKKLGYLCGPAGVAPPTDDFYIVRPCVNFRMMSAGAQFMSLGPNNHDQVPDGYFWCEIFGGRHMSFDYHWGVQTLAVEGFRDNPTQLNRFCKWTKVDDTFVLPDIIAEMAQKYEWLNVEVIGDKIIEVHLRYNDDFSTHQANTIIPIWKDQFYQSECGDRLGFILMENKQ